MQPDSRHQSRLELTSAPSCRCGQKYPTPVMLIVNNPATHLHQRHHADAAKYPDTRHVYKFLLVQYQYIIFQDGSPRTSVYKVLCWSGAAHKGSRWASGDDITRFNILWCLHGNLNWQIPDLWSQWLRGQFLWGPQIPSVLSSFLRLWAYLLPKLPEDLFWFLHCWTEESNIQRPSKG